MSAEIINTPKLVAIDGDRTAWDPDKAAKSLIRIGTAAHPFIGDVISDIKARTENNGGSFDVLRELERIGVPADEIDGLCEEFATNPGVDIKYEDTEPFLEQVEATPDYMAMIATWGSPKWQVAKIRAAALDHIPYTLMEKLKGHNIHDCKIGDNYHFQTVGGLIVAKTVLLIDDKSISFAGLPQDCKGKLLRRPGAKLLKSQMGSIPKNVDVISGLFEAIERR